MTPTACATYSCATCRPASPRWSAAPPEPPARAGTTAPRGPRSPPMGAWWSSPRSRHNLSADDEDAYEDVFVRDMALGTTTLVSRASGAAGRRRRPRVLRRGHLRRRHARGVRLGGGQPLGRRRPRLAGRLRARPVRRHHHAGQPRDGPDGAPADANSLSPALSTDGRLVAFSSARHEPLGRGRRRLPRRLRARPRHRGDDPGEPGGRGLRGGRRRRLLRALAVGRRTVRRLLVAGRQPLRRGRRLPGGRLRARPRGQRHGARRAAGSGGGGAAGDGDSFAASISSDGSRVAFNSEARNLSAEDGDGTTDVFVRDLPSGLTTLASRAAGPLGAAADDNVFTPEISGDGRFVAFHSAADNLSGEDLNGFANVFRRDVEQRPAARVPRRSAARARPGAHACAATALRAGIVGTPHHDVIRGTRGRDVIAALGGNDLVAGARRERPHLPGRGERPRRRRSGRRPDPRRGRRRPARGGRRRGPPGGRSGPRPAARRPRADRLLGLAGRDAGRGGPGADVCRLESARAC